MPDPDDDYDDRPRRPRRDYDEDDDRPRRRRRPPAGDDGLQYVVPVNTNLLAILAGYAGLVSVLCFPAPVALVLGVLALRDLKQKPEQHGKGRAIFGIVMGVIFTVVMLVAATALAIEKWN